MCRNQLGRRNLTDEQKTYLIGKQCEAQSQTIPNPEGINQYSEVGCQNDAQPKGPGKTAEIISRMNGVPKRTVQRAVQFSKGLDAAQGESVNGFINRAIDHEMERDTAGGPSEATGARLGVGAISFTPPATIKAAREAAEAAGEELPVFVTRAVETQAQRDALSRRMKGGKVNE